MLKKDRVCNELRRKILRGGYHPGERLPGEIALSRSLKVSRITLRAALQTLSAEGLLEINGHSGNYVSDAIQRRRYLFIVTSPDIINLNLVDAYLSSALRGQLSEHGDHLELLSCSQLGDFQENQWDQLLHLDPPSGIFLHGRDYSGCSRILEAFRRLPKNTVIIGSLRADGKDISDGHPAVLTESRRFLTAGIRHLQQLGHQRIASIFPAGSDLRGFTLPGYEEFLRSEGLEDCISLTAVCSPDRIEEQTRIYMSAAQPPTAFMCYCDATAQRVCSGLHKIGISIPRQVSVLGICGYSRRLYMNPPLSVVNFHYDRIARQALELAAGLQEGPLSPAQSRTTCEFSIEDNGSTAALSSTIFP